jgi:hypothetical protein
MPVTVIAQDGQPLIFPQKGLQIPRRLSFEKWIAIGQQLSSVTTSTSWCLGDWLAYGEAAFTGRYRAAIERTSLEYQTLRNYAWVAKRFALSRRRDNLSFAHHAEVAALPEPEQEYWLNKADELSWSRNQLRANLRSSLKEREVAGRGLPGEAGPVDPDRGTASAATPEPDATSIPCPELTLKVRITVGQMEICKAAAAADGLNLEEWLLRALEEAARKVLSPQLDKRSLHPPTG